MSVIAPLQQDALGRYIRIGALTFRPTGETLYDQITQVIVTVHEPFAPGGPFWVDVQERAADPYREVWPESRIGAAPDARTAPDAPGPCAACGRVYGDDADDTFDHREHHEALGFVACDDFCPAKENPETRDDFILAYTHWRRHKYLSGCSHAR